MAYHPELIPVFARRQTVASTHIDGTFDALYTDELPADTMSLSPGDHGPFMALQGLDLVYEGRFFGRADGTHSIKLTIGDVEMGVLDSLATVTAKAFWQVVAHLVSIDADTAGVSIDSKVAWKDAGSGHDAGDVFVQKHAFFDIAVDLSSSAALVLSGATSGANAAVGDVDVRMGRASVTAVAVS